MTETSDSPIPILFCITELEPGGAELALVQLVTRIDRTRWEPHVIALGRETELVDQLRSAGIPTICLNATSWRQFSIYPRLVRQFRKIKPAIVQTYLFHANILGRMAARSARVKHVVSGIRVAERRGKWYHLVDRWTDRWVSKHVCVSRAVRDFTLRMTRIPAEKMVVIPNGVDLSRFSDALPIPRESLPACNEQDLLALFVGRLDPQKGVFDLLNLAQNLKESLPHLKWLIAGEGVLKQEMENRIEKMNLNDRVHLLGRRDDVAQLMRTADLFVFPSRWEGMPNVILEAMAARVPVVSYDVEGIQELLSDQQSGLIVPGGNITEMARAIASLATSLERRQHYAEKAFEKVRDQFSWEQTVSQYERLYESLINENS